MDKDRLKRLPVGGGRMVPGPENGFKSGKGRRPKFGQTVPPRASRKDWLGGRHFTARFFWPTVWRVPMGLDRGFGKDCERIRIASDEKLYDVIKRGKRPRRPREARGSV